MPLCNLIVIKFYSNEDSINPRKYSLATIHVQEESDQNPCDGHSWLTIFSQPIVGLHSQEKRQTRHRIGRAGLLQHRSPGSSASNDKELLPRRHCNRNAIKSRNVAKEV